MFDDVDGQAIKNVCNDTQKGIYGALSFDFEQLGLL
jgi:hypothetical protein